MKNRQRWVNAVSWTVVGSIAATFVFSPLTWRSAWPQILLQSLANAIYSGSCVALCLAVIPRVAPLARRRLPFPLDWAAIIVALIVMGAAGSVVATTLGVILGFIPRDRFFASWYPNALKISIYFTLLFGLTGTVIQELRGRLARTTVALRTKERDEADARRLVAEAQLASLEARVDPHFLFNTLNSIAALIRENPPAAERVVVQLASLMRSSLDRRGLALVALDEELALVRSYLEIEHVRFGDRLRFTIEPLAGGGAPLLPRLSLQTLVENSVKYAVSPSREGAAITVRASKIDDRLRVSVDDDGPGFDAAHVLEGHGLQLLKSRLAMIFGARAEMRTMSRPGNTSIVLDLPFETVQPVPAGEIAGAGTPAQDPTCL